MKETTINHDLNLNASQILHKITLYDPLNNNVTSLQISWPFRYVNSNCSFSKQGPNKAKVLQKSDSWRKSPLMAMISILNGGTRGQGPRKIKALSLPCLFLRGTVRQR